MNVVHNILPKIFFSSILVVLCATAFPQPAPAHAAFPGYNGKIVFASTRDGNYEIYTMNADGSQQTRLTNDPGTDQNPVWSPDGTKIAFISNRTGDNEIYVMQSDGSNLVRLTTNPANDSRPSWSPDGTKLAFSSDRDGNSEIYIMNSDGTNPVRLTNNTASDVRPSWSPDGKHIAFASTRDGANPEIYIMNADGTNQIRLTNNGAVNDDKPDWSPDGQHIVFHSSPAGNNDIYTMAPDGSNITRLTIDPGIDSTASWSPDGMHIAFQSNRSGDYEIYTMATDGSGQTRLTNNTASDEQANWQPIPNKAPIVANDALSTAFNTPASIDILANDSDEEALSANYLTIKTAPSHGTVQIKDGQINFMPVTNYSGSDQLTYQICDSFMLNQKCSTAVLDITVQAGPTPAIPIVNQVGTVQLNGETKIYYTGHRPSFSGTAQPGSTIKVEIHSDPIILTTTADASGIWSVVPDQDIPNGEHQVIITATKDGATSQPLNLVLGINTGLATTGTPLWPISLAGLIGLVYSRSLLQKRSEKWSRI